MCVCVHVHMIGVFMSVLCVCMYICDVCVLSCTYVMHMYIHVYVHVHYFNISQHVHTTAHLNYTGNFP